MNNLEKLKNKLSRNTNEVNNTIGNKIVLLNIFLLLSIALSFFSGIYFFLISNNSDFTFLSFGFAFVFLLNYIFITKTLQIERAIIMFLSLVSTTLLASVTFSDLEPFIFILTGVYPFFLIVLLGEKKGSLFLSLIFVLVVILYIVHPVHNYTLALKVQSLLSYLFFWFIAVSYILVKDISYSKLENKLLFSEQQLEKKNEFISLLSYQIRTPLNSINGVVELISKTELTPEQVDLLNTIKASSNNLVSVVNNIGGQAGIQLISQDYDSEDFNLPATIRNTLSLFLSDKFQAIKFNITISDKVPEIVGGHPVKVKQIILNVIEFFIKYYPEESKPIALDIVLNISKENEDNISISFEFKAKTSLLIDINEFNLKNKTKEGENIDYAITRQLIASANGSMNVISNPFETIFSFALQFLRSKPTGELDLLTDKAEKQRSLRRDKKIESLDEALVLIVEDNLINQKIMVLSLKKLVHDIVIANNGQEALDSMENTNFDIVLMDIQMPVMDGLEASMKIRSDEKNGTEIPIIAITANALHGDRESCLAAGMNDYISKPFKLEILLEKMKQHLKVAS